MNQLYGVNILVVKDGTEFFDKERNETLVVTKNNAVYSNPNTIMMVQEDFDLLQQECKKYEKAL